MATNIIGFGYTFFPVLIWAALRFGSQGAVTVTAMASAVAIWGTAQEVGPFVRGALHESLLALQAFMSIAAGTGLVLAAEVAERQRMAAYLQVSLQEKEVLLKEVHHRVKNNLQVISSLLNLQADSLTDPLLRVLVTDSQQRIRSIALVHELLYHADNLAQISLAQYITRLVQELTHAYVIAPERIALQTQIEEAWVDLDTAIPWGLLLHELLSNCFKHAFPKGQAGVVRVELRATAQQRLVLRVEDTGCGFPVGLDFRATNSLGLQLVCELTEQLQGTIALERDGGTCFTITVPA
jgi:two-component sensor histidine kinase